MIDRQNHHTGFTFFSLLVITLSLFTPLLFNNTESIKQVENKLIEYVISESEDNINTLEYDNLDFNTIENIINNTPLDLETAKIIKNYSQQYSIDISLILAIIEQESNFNQYAVGKHNDRGYMQIIPNTEKWLAEAYGEKIGISYNPERIFDADYNIGLGVAYISMLCKAYGNNFDRILSEYNRGPYNLKKYYEANRTYETAYSRSILNREKKYRHLNTVE